MTKFKLQIKTPLANKSWNTIYTGTKTHAIDWHNRILAHLGCVHAMRVIRQDDDETTVLLNMRRTCQSCDNFIHGVDSCRCDAGLSLGHDVHNIVPEEAGFNTDEVNDCQKYY